MSFIKHQNLHTKHGSWMKILQSIHKICVGNNNENEELRLILNKDNYFDHDTTKKLAKFKVPRTMRHKRATQRKKIDFHVSEIQQATCPGCSDRMHAIDSRWSNTSNKINIDETASCQICSINITKLHAVYKCVNFKCRIYVCGNCNGKKYVKNILDHVYTKKTISLSLVRKLFFEWFEKYKPNADLIVELLNKQEMINFVSDEAPLACVFKIWLPRMHDKTQMKTMLNQILTFGNFQQAVKTFDIGLLQLFDEYGFDFVSNIDKRFDRSNCTALLELSREFCKDKLRSKLVACAKMLFDLSNKHNAKIDILPLMSVIEMLCKIVLCLVHQK